MKLRELKNWLAFNSRVLLSPTSLFQKNEYAGSQIRTFAVLTLALSSLSWATGLYMLRSGYSLTFIFYITLLSLAQFYIIKLSLPLFQANLDQLIQKKHGAVNSDKESVELLGFFSTLPWVFFTAFVGIAKSTAFPSLCILMAYIWLALWSFAIFVLGSQGFYGISFSQLSLMTLKSLGRTALFPLLAFAWFILQLYSYSAG